MSPKKGAPLQLLHAALLVLDMQAYFLEPASHAYVPSAKAIVDGVVELVESAYASDVPVIFTQHLNTVANAGMMSTWWKELISAENPLHQIIPAFDLSKARVIQKSQYDAFYDTGLGELLHELSVKQVIICGVMTHLCCETTARSAFMRGFEVFFPVDGTATYRLDYHRASLLNLAHGFASIVLIKDILQAMQGTDER